MNYPIIKINKTEYLMLDRHYDFQKGCWVLLLLDPNSEITSVEMNEFSTRYIFIGITNPVAYVDSYNQETIDSV